MEKLEKAARSVTAEAPENIVAAYRPDGSVFIQINLRDRGKILELLFLVMGAVLKNGGRKHG